MNTLHLREPGYENEEGISEVTVFRTIGDLFKGMRHGNQNSST
jgi:hypothetical protein